MLAIRHILPLRHVLAALLSTVVAFSAFGGQVLGGETTDLSNASTSKHDVGGARASSACRPQDQMWVVSTRGVGCPKSGEAPALCFAVRDAEGVWHETTLDAFLAATAGSQARFWIHGYGVTPEEAVNVGGVAHEQFVASDEPPLKFVVWSWPSEREGYRRVKDIREKGCRAQVESYCLAWLITRMSADADVSMVGYSYGTRIIAGGLHLVGGGELCGGLSLNLPAVVLASDVGRNGAVLNAPSRHCRAVMLAAAMGSDWLVEGGFNERALGQTSEMLSIFSSDDRVLKFYPLATKEKHDHALGYRGLATRPVRDDANGKFAELDVNYLIGTDHSLETYLGHLEIAAAARHALAAKAMSAASESASQSK
jgi:hypothetical protein